MKSKLSDFLFILSGITYFRMKLSAVSDQQSVKSPFFKFFADS